MNTLTFLENERDTVLNVIEDNCKAANNSFLYYLHERDVFDIEAFTKLLDCINVLEEKQEDMLEQLYFIQNETLKHIIYHFDPNDMSRITNLPDDYWDYLLDLENTIGNFKRMYFGDNHEQ
ncbi:MAG: hypothetical protein K2H91_12775 [Lachnospiraceae bacterium]|nr:hypothetical protein [Lachnospiraceae bacterium]